MSTTKAMWKRGGDEEREAEVFHQQRNVHSDSEEKNGSNQRKR
jgi:hypothetical protein